jgi:hypothetical protein
MTFAAAVLDTAGAYAFAGQAERDRPPIRRQSVPLVPDLFDDRFEIHGFPLKTKTLR